MLSYADRLKLLREKKIQHTLEKRDQNGYQDADDYGTVPIQEGYHMVPWFNKPNGCFGGYDGMAENFCRMVAAHEPYVDPLEMLCGRWRDMLENYRRHYDNMLPWVQKNVKEAEPYKSGTCEHVNNSWDEEKHPYDELKPYQKKYCIVSGIGGNAHFACDYRIGFELGFGGLLEKVRHYREINKDKKDFYDAEEKCLLAIIDFIDRHIAKIDTLLETETRPEIRENLEEMKKVCKKVRLDPPETFHEMCQWTAFFNCVSRMYTRDGAGFQMDSIMYPFYEKDIKEGRLDDEKAKFLIANLFLIDPHYFQVSGADENGNDTTNHLSYLILDAADSLNIACNLTVRVHEKSDPEFLKKAVFCLLKHKNAWPRFCNDKALAEGYMKNGAPMSVARQRIAVGCNWMAVPGKEYPMNDMVKINIAKVFEEAMNDLRNEKEKSTERLFEIYEKHLTKAIEVTAAGINLHLDYQWEFTPELIMDLMFENSIEKGLDASVCAEYHTIGIDGAGLAVVADSLGAISTRIEDEKMLTWDQLYEALDNNFADERTRLILNSSPKYCKGGSVSDRWAKRLTDSWVSHILAQKMPEGRCLIPGWFSWSNTIMFGKAVKATPNGRRAGEPISHGANPNPHFRTDGAPTAQSNGIASVQCGRGNTAPLQIEFDPQVAADEKGVEVVLNLILSHFRQGGTLININVLDGDKLMAAHKNPDLYPDLVVRVTGFTAYFASLSPEFRQLVVDRFLSGK